MKLFQKLFPTKKDSECEEVEGPLDYNAILKHLGPFGWWQKVNKYNTEVK